ncbi:EamA family transporter (plasmid) [Pseudoalteromonas sp. T1lg65]|uniref:EamA family transporter n=1 Tax=Pseudoalteromonas sp. T1lg65 TaxID=2077101 RepID=UPI003F79F650
MDKKSVLLVLLVVFVWGVNFPIIKIGLVELPPILFSAMRFLIVAIPAVLFIPRPKTSFWNVLGVGLFLGVLKFSFLFVAMQSEVSAGLSSLLLQAQVLFTIILSMVFFKESLDRYQGIGIIIAIVGFGLFFLNTGGGTSIWGLILLLSAAIFWSISNLIMKRLSGVNLLHFIVWVSLIPPLPLLMLSLLLESPDPLGLLLSASSQTWLALAYVGYVSTLLAFAVWGWLLRSNNAAQVTPFALLIPVVGLASASFMLGEQLTLLEAVGGLTILLGLFISVVGKRTQQWLTDKRKKLA